MKKSIFITGTDTGVGKTFVAVGLIKAMKERGLDVCPMKPVESGCRIMKGKLLPEDTVRLLKASGVDESIDAVNPYRFKHSVAPSVAADIEGLKIKKKKICSAYKRLAGKHDMTIVEGAGGIMVPVYKKYLFIDLIDDLGLPIVIVSRPGLGTINHTLLTIEAAKNRGVGILGVIINYAVKSKTGLSEKTNPDLISKLSGVPVIGIVPNSSSLSRNSNKKVFNNIAEEIMVRLQVEP